MGSDPNSWHTGILRVFSLGSNHSWRWWTLRAHCSVLTAWTDASVLTHALVFASPFTRTSYRPVIMALFAGCPGGHVDSEAKCRNRSEHDAEKLFNVVTAPK